MKVSTENCKILCTDGFCHRKCRNNDGHDFCWKSYKKLRSTLSKRIAYNNVKYKFQGFATPMFIVSMKKYTIHTITLSLIYVRCLFFIIVFLVNFSVMRRLTTFLKFIYHLLFRLILTNDHKIEEELTGNKVTKY